MSKRPYAFLPRGIFSLAITMGIATLATTLGRQMNPTDSSRIIGYLTTSLAIGQMIGPSIAGILASATQSYHIALVGASTVVFIGGLLLISGLKYEKPTYQQAHMAYRK